jgi:hypothetical protein
LIVIFSVSLMPTPQPSITSSSVYHLRGWYTEGHVLVKQVFGRSGEVWEGSYGGVVFRALP